MRLGVFSPTSLDLGDVGALNLILAENKELHLLNVRIGVIMIERLILVSL